MVKGATMLVLIDNYDSFTYNLYQYLSELGQDVVVLRNDQTTIAAIEELKPERLVISPGPCSPREAGISNDTGGFQTGGAPGIGFGRRAFVGVQSDAAGGLYLAGSV